MRTRTRNLWLLSIAVTLGLVGYFTARLVSADRSIFNPGPMTDGHYQIGVACDACHTPFGGVKQEACLNCHGAELAAVEDSHPKKKFDDPRNADRLQTIDARWCVTCHVEHRPERTNAMGVTRPNDYCFYCHQETGKERPSHANLAFETCASAGCHNYHDNKALYEDFLVKHASEPPLQPSGRVATRALQPWLRAEGVKINAPLRVSDQNAPPTVNADKVIVTQWSVSRHAKGGVNCGDCHDAMKVGWVRKPGLDACQSCHRREADGFLDSRHGMRLRQRLPAMRVADARRPMRSDAHDKSLSCASCHDPHSTDTRKAAVDACLGCHDDRHSGAYKASKHYQRWLAETGGSGVAGSGVSCATCHLPREVHRDGEITGTRVQHNQSYNLRPNEKMIRSVCMSCHGLPYAIDALADRKLIDSNFQGSPSAHIQSVDMAVARVKQPKSRRQP